MDYNKLYSNNNELFWSQNVSVVRKAIELNCLVSPILDLWCWQWRNTIDLIKKWYDVVGIDINNIAVQDFKNKVNQIIDWWQVTLYNQDVRTYDFWNEKTILMIYVLHFLWHDYKAILAKILSCTPIWWVHVLKTFLDEWSLQLKYGAFKREELLDIYIWWDVKHYEEWYEFTLESDRERKHLTAELIAIKK